MTSGTVVAMISGAVSTGVDAANVVGTVIADVVVTSADCDEQLAPANRLQMARALVVDVTDGLTPGRSPRFPDCGYRPIAGGCAAR